MEICILVGEKSGDSHAAALIPKLKQKFPHATFYGTGGPSMQKEGVHLLTHIQDLAMMGLAGATRVLPAVYKTYKTLKKKWQTQPPDLIIPIDYGGFNLRVCKLAKRMSIPVYYYIPPKIWAWDQKRVNILRETTRMAFVINPFELNFYTQHGVNAIYVGNPSAWEIAQTTFDANFKSTYKLDPTKKLIGIFPGSRRKEIEKLAPIFIQAIESYHSEHPLTEYVICCPSSIDAQIYQPLIKAAKVPIAVIHDDNFNLMKNADFLILKSGTTTLEAGLIGTPMVVCYILDKFSYTVIKNFIKVKYISLVNLNLDQPIVKELIQHHVTSENILREMLAIMQNPAIYAEQKQYLTNLQQIIGNKNPADTVAGAIFEDFIKLKP